MGNCTICSQPAGFLKKQHKECVEKLNNGINEIINTTKEFVISSEDTKKLDEKISSIAIDCFIPKNLIQELILKGWEQAVEIAFEDNVLTKEEEENLFNFATAHSFDLDDLNKNVYYLKVVKGAILREIIEGIIPERVNTSSGLPFNFKKDEKIIWVFQNVDYYELKTKRQYVGGYQGVSVKIAKGLYYRTGGFKGHPVESLETMHIDNGLIAITNEHLYFSGDFKSFRINYNKIISCKPYSDGIEIQRDASTAKPQSFKTGDGWFTYNLVMNLSKLNQ